MSAHEPGEVLVRLSREEAIALYDNDIGTNARCSGAAKLREALAADDTAQNPPDLVLPWEAKDIGAYAADRDCWTVVYRDGEKADLRCNEAQARLMAAAPELADALDAMLAEVDHAPESVLEAACTALRKAGRAP